MFQTERYLRMEYDMRRNRRYFISGMVLGAIVSNCMTFRAVFPRPAIVWKRERYDCAVVCGCPAAADGSPSRVMKARVEAAADLWKKGKVGKVVFSGAAVKNSYTEAEVMKKYGMSLGLLEEDIITESQAVSTYHNMMLVKPLMEENGLSSCVVVTNSWHLRKANHYAEKFGLDYVMYPSGKPEGTGKLYSVWHHIILNLHMYLNLYRGLY